MAAVPLSAEELSKAACEQVVVAADRLSRHVTRLERINICSFCESKRQHAEDGKNPPDIQFL